MINSAKLRGRIVETYTTQTAFAKAVCVVYFSTILPRSLELLIMIHLLFVFDSIC